jgi:hypothetical protein
MAIVNATIVNQKKLEQALIDAFETWAEEDINDAHWDDQFREDRWQYSNVTTRKNGESVGSPRDIYDLGALYESGINSYKFSAGPNGAEANWHWDATNASGREYAWYVHEGLGTNVTARPFTDDISLPSSFFRKAPGKALLRRVQSALGSISAR